MAAREENYLPDEIIIKEGVMSPRMYIVLEGEVILYSNYGKESEYVIGIYGKGKVFGEFNLFTESPNPFTAIAYKKVKVAWFERNNLSSFIYGYPDSALSLLESIFNSHIRIVKDLQMAIEELNEIRKLSETEEFKYIVSPHHDDQDDSSIQYHYIKNTNNES